MTQPTFALIGAAGFVAKRHFDAIHFVGGKLVAALDIHDSVGLIDSYAPDCHFFTEPERFDRHLNRHSGEIDYVVVCSPNFLHDSHCRWALRSGANAICEKPVVLKPHNLDQLQRLEEETGKKVFPVLQLRYHPDIVRLRRELDVSKHHTAKVNYVTRRGRWYETSWKGDIAKSGGVAYNLGVHFFDMLCHLFGIWEASTVTMLESDCGMGHIEFDNAECFWALSTSEDDLPPYVKQNGGYAYRDLRIDDKIVANYSEGFTDLHNQVYEAIMAGDGLSLEDTRASIRLCDAILNHGRFK